MATHLFDGITARVIDTARIRTNILERTGDAPETPADRTFVLIHGNVSSALFWQEQMLALPADLRVIAIDLRGFGDSEVAPVDATRGLGDYADDVAATLDALGIGPTHLVGWSMGGGVIMKYALTRPVLSLTLQAPVSPYGFGTTAADGSRLTDDDAGSGAGGVNPDFIERLAAGDMSDEAPTSPRSVFRGTYVAPGYTSEHEDVWVASMNSTKVVEGNYPGDSTPSENWPGFAPGDVGVLNTMAPKHHNVAGIVDLVEKPPVLWIHGTADAIVGDASLFDINNLGALGAIPGWPGAEIAPVQPMVSQTRAVLSAYEAAGGQVTELELDGVGHSPHLEAPEKWRAALLTHIGA